MDLQEMQFQLLDGEDAADGAKFGYGLDVAVLDGGFDPGELGWLTQDAVNPMRGVTLFGRDMPTGRTWGWNLFTDQVDTSTALAALGALAKSWRGDAYVGEPGRLTAMRYRIGGRIRRVYGRPRRFAAPPTNLILGGFVPVTADFALVDANTYDDEPSSLTLTWSSDSDGGFVLPATFPISTLPSSERLSSAVVGGDTATYPVVTFTGPITDPYLATDDWTLQLKGSIAAGSKVVVDLRPWSVSVLKDGVNAVGMLGRRQWLEDMKLTPGANAVKFGGNGNASGGTCAVSWRNAWTSL